MKQFLLHLQKEHKDNISECLEKCKKNVFSAADVQSDLTSNSSDLSSDKKKNDKVKFFVLKKW